MKFIALTPASTSWKLRGFALTHVIPNVYHLLGNRVSVCTTFFLDALNLLTPIIKLWPTVLCNDRGEVMTVTPGQGVDGGRIPNPDDLLLLLHLFHICSRARSVSTISYNTTSFPYFCPISLLIHNYSSHIDSPPAIPIVTSNRWFIQISSLHFAAWEETAACQAVNGPCPHYRQGALPLGSPS